jgi:hypothetical protein
VEYFEPRCPDLAHEVDVTDGCACQFAGRNNYHQTAEWKVQPSLAHAFCRVSLPSSLPQPFGDCVSGQDRR